MASSVFLTSKDYPSPETLAVGVQQELKDEERHSDSTSLFGHTRPEKGRLRHNQQNKSKPKPSACCLHTDPGRALGSSWHALYSTFPNWEALSHHLILKSCRICDSQRAEHLPEVTEHVR